MGTINSAPFFKEYANQNRAHKLARYLSKKSKRNYEKRVVYASRKEAADAKSRVKGKFSTKQQGQAIISSNALEMTPKKSAYHLSKKESLNIS